MESILFFVVGTAMGSFGNVLIERLPGREPISGRSRCPYCRRSLCWFELIPVCSFLLLGGRCRTCRHEISWQYPIVELTSGFLFVLSFILRLPFHFLHSFILWLLLLLAIVDARHETIPDVLNIPFFLLAVIYGMIVGRLDFLAIVIGGGWFALQWAVSRGRWIGSGDIILGAGIGAFLGSWRNIVLCLLFAYIIGAVVSLVLILFRKKTRKDHIAFAPFLAVGTFLTLMFAQKIFNFQFSIFN